MARKNERTVLVKTMDKYDERNDETYLYIRVGANKKTTKFRVIKQPKGLFQFYGSDTVVSLDYIERVVNYEYDIAGEDYVVYSIHKRISKFYTSPLYLTINSAAFIQIKTHCKDLLTEKGQTYDPELFETKEYASDIIATTTFVNLICLMSFYLDLPPMQVIPKSYRSTCIAILYFTQYLYEEGTEHSDLTLYDWIVQKKEIMKGFEGFLKEESQGQKHRMKLFSEQAIDYIMRNTSELTVDEIATYCTEIASIFDGSTSWNAARLKDS